MRTEVELYEGISTTVEVQGTGLVIEGDAVKIALRNDDTYLVTAVNTTAGTIDLYNENAGSVVLCPGDRMLPTDSTPQMYSDPEAQNAIWNAWPDEHGVVVFYPLPTLCDAVLAEPEEVGTRLFIDLEGGWIDGSADYVNAARYASLQSALDACSPGARLYLPSGTYPAPSGGLIVTKPIEIFGDGPNRTVLVQHPATIGSAHPVIKIDSTGGSIAYVRVHDLALRNPAQAGTRQDGAHGISCITGPDRKVTEVRLSRLSAYTLDDDAFHFEGHDLGSGAVVFLQGDCVEAVQCHGSGFYIENATAVQFLNSYAIANDLFGAYCLASQASWYACAFENNCHFDADAKAKPSAPICDYTEDWGAQLRLKLCSIARVDACDFEDFTYLGPPYAPTSPPFSGLLRHAPTALILEGSTGALVSNCTFLGQHYVPDAEDSTPQVAGTAVRVTGYGWATVMPSLIKDVETTVQVAEGAGPCSIHPQLVSLSTGVPSGASASLTSPGFAIPALPRAQIASAGAANGQMVVDSTNGLLLLSYNGAWTTIASLVTE